MNHLIKQTLEFYKTNKKKIWNYIIVIGIIIFVSVVIIIINEVLGAWEFCKSTGSIYKIDYPTLTHACNGSPIYRYNPGGWGYPIPIN